MYLFIQRLNEMPVGVHIVFVLFIVLFRNEGRNFVSHESIFKRERMRFEIGHGEGQPITMVAFFQIQSTNVSEG